VSRDSVARGQVPAAAREPLAHALHFVGAMKLALLVSLLAACIDAPQPADPAITEAVTAEPIGQADAAALCEPGLHLPTDAELRELLGDCVETRYGWQCTPCRAGNCDERFGDDLTVLQHHIWSSTPCTISGDRRGAYYADLALGQVVCAAAADAEALPLCVR